MPRPADKREANARKVRNYRERMRAKGLRQVQMWVPDTRSEEFRAEAKRQCLLIANSHHEKEDNDFIESISLLNDPDFDEWK